MITVLLADDHKMILEVLEVGLEQHNKFQVIGTVGNGNKLFHFLRTNELPDVLVLDLRMPQFKGLESVKVLLHEFPSLKILVLTMEDHYSTIKSAIEMGVKGYVTKTDDFAELEKGITEIMAGKSYLSTEVVQQMLKLGNISKWLSAEHVAEISHREKEVLKLLSEGMMHKAIADRLCISTHTVKTHRKNLLKKLNANSTQELVERAAALGVLTED